MQATIRHATAHDLEGLNRLLHQVQNVHADGRPDLFRHGGKKYTDDALRDILANPETPVFVAVNAAEDVLGYAFCAEECIAESTSRQPIRDFYLDDLCIEETCRGTGLGKQLYAFVRKYAKAQGFDRITLHVWSCNPRAEGFYRHLGMQPYYTAMEDIL